VPSVIYEEENFPRQMYQSIQDLCPSCWSNTNQYYCGIKMKMTAFLDIASCSVVEVYRRFRGAYVALMMTVSTSETSVKVYQTTPRNIPEDGHLRRLTLQRYDESVRRL
jgi:hypothetical protein